MAERPLSPHLGIWKWGPAMLVSILHRVTGNGMAFVALPVLLWWLGSLASGPEAYETFAGIARARRVADHRRTALAQRLRDGLADAAAGAGDEDGGHRPLSLN